MSFSPEFKCFQQVLVIKQYRILLTSILEIMQILLNFITDQRR